MRALLAALVLVLAMPAVAQATDDRDHPDKDRDRSHGRDRDHGNRDRDVSWTLEPPGVNCSGGGWKVTIDGETPFYLCNGPTGEPVAPPGFVINIVNINIINITLPSGEDVNVPTLPPATPGDDGAPGTPGDDGAPGQPGGPGEPTTPRVCVSRWVTHWRLVVRKNHRVSGMKINFEGVPAPTRRFRRDGRVNFLVTIDMRGLNRGIYVARAVYRLDDNRFKRQRVQYWRPCTGNPKGGKRAGLNRDQVSIL